MMKLGDLATKDLLHLLFFVVAIVCFTVLVALGRLDQKTSALVFVGLLSWAGPSPLAKLFSSTPSTPDGGPSA